MSYVESFGWGAVEWSMHKATIENTTIEQLSHNEQFGAYICRCVDKLNEVTVHLASLPIRNDYELRESLNIIRQLNRMDDYADLIDGFLSNINMYLERKEKLPKYDYGVLLDFKSISK